MSLLSENVKSVVQFGAVADSNVSIGLKGRVETGVNYKYYIGKCKPNVLDGTFLLLDVVTGKPINLSNQLLVSVIFYSDSEDPLTADSNTAFSLYGLTKDLSNSSGYGASTSIGDIDNVYYVNMISSYTSGSTDYTGNNAYPLAAIYCGGGSTNPTGTLVVKIQTTTF
jgi:hypothetical protein